jgi:hypothetical protein
MLRGSEGEAASAVRGSKGEAASAAREMLRGSGHVLANYSLELLYILYWWISLQRVQAEEVELQFVCSAYLI